MQYFKKISQKKYFFRFYSLPPLTDFRIYINMYSKTFHGVYRIDNTYPVPKMIQTIYNNPLHHLKIFVSMFFKR